MAMDLVLASGNQGKLRELKALLHDLPVRCVAQSEFDVPEVAETGTTFVENAIIKARHAASVTGNAALADDSGLVVTALNGAPGVRSARYAGEHASDAQNNQLLQKSMRAIDAANRGCAFVCVIVLLRHADDPLPIISSGRWVGEVLREPRGAHGFGYDPLFFDTELQCSAAELEAARKNRISHRGQALAGLKAQLLNADFLRDEMPS